MQRLYTQPSDILDDVGPKRWFHRLHPTLILGSMAVKWLMVNFKWQIMKRKKITNHNKYFVDMTSPWLGSTTSLVWSAQHGEPLRPPRCRVPTDCVSSLWTPGTTFSAAPCCDGDLRWLHPSPLVALAAVAIVVALVVLIKGSFDVTTVVEMRCWWLMLWLMLCFAFRPGAVSK